MDVSQPGLLQIPQMLRACCPFLHHTDIFLQ